jgi:hypothetical protein
MKRFWSKVKQGEPNECWLWQASTAAGTGYGKFRIGESIVGAHRFAYQLAKGPIPAGLHVMHSCDTPACVNPRHLSVGTAQDNFDDMERKGRRVIAAPSRAKLSVDDVQRIRSLASMGGRHSEIARTYGVSYQCVDKVVARLRWKDVA